MSSRVSRFAVGGALVAAALLTGCTPLPDAAPVASAPPHHGGGLRIVKRTTAPQPSPTPLATVTLRPTPEATARPTAQLGTPTPTAKPTCRVFPGKSREVRHLDVVAGRGSLAVSWMDYGDPGIVTYRLAAVPEAPPRPGDTATHVKYQNVQRAEGCRTMQIEAGLTGLTSGARYQVWLTALYARRDGLPGYRDRQIGYAPWATIG